MSTVTLGFQNNSGTATNPTFFNLELPQDGKKHQLSDLISKATSGGNPVKVPSDFIVSEVILSKPGQLASGGSVEVDGPVGKLGTLSEKTTTVKPAAAVKDVSLKASK